MKFYFVVGEERCTAAFSESGNFFPQSEKSTNHIHTHNAVEVHSSPGGVYFIFSAEGKKIFTRLNIYDGMLKGAKMVIVLVRLPVL